MRWSFKRLKESCIICGLFGFQWHSADSVPRHDKMIALLAVLAAANDRRGGDSWGYYVPEKDRIRQGLGTFSAGPGYLPFLRRTSLVAHTRMASCGKVTKENAHPFRVGGTVGAHNGCVSNHQELCEKYGRTVEVDSLHLFHHIEDGLPFADIEAYGAVSFVQTHDPEGVYLGRFNDGELAVAEVGGHGLVWSSTKTALSAALDVARLPHEFYKVSQGTLYQAVQGVLYDTVDRLNFAPYRSAARWNSSLKGQGNKPSGTHMPIYDEDEECCLVCGTILRTFTEMRSGVCHDCAHASCKDCGEIYEECQCAWAGSRDGFAY